MKKFEEGVFSDLRNLKPGVDACLEEPKVCMIYQYKTVAPFEPNSHLPASSVSIS